MGTREPAPAAPSDRSDERARAGLCATCVHADVITSSKQSVFYRCRLSETDARFRRYPVLPVTTCGGYEAGG
jgi:hypothetical protein